MKTWKIIEIQSVNEFTNDYWTTYYFKMKMDNWEVISIWKKRKDAFKLGDTLTYEEYTNSKGKQAWREAKENNFKKWEFKQDQRGYFTSIAFQIAFQSYSWEDSYKYCSDLARRIFADMLDNYENKQPEENKNTENTDTKTQNKQAELEDLPF